MPTLAPDIAKELRQRLDAARADVINHIRSRLADSGDPAAVSLLAHLGQPDDMSQATNLGDNEMAQLGQEQAELSAIDSSIRRLDTGVANVCIVCGQAIPDERLLAIPTAQTCVNCQQQIETADGAPRGPTM